jgi:hypothetical protein
MPEPWNPQRTLHPVKINSADGHHADLLVMLPGLDVLPLKKARVTPTGRLSSKAWTKTEINDAYVDLLGVNLVATVRESWATGPSLTHSESPASAEDPAVSMGTCSPSRSIVPELPGRTTTPEQPCSTRRHVASTG